MRDRVVVSGATGLVGRAVVGDYRAAGRPVVTIGRGPESDVQWVDEAAVTAAVDGAALVLNLAGRNVNCRYTRENRTVILRSRLDTTHALGAAIAVVAEPPPVWINASSATIYRNEVYVPMTEDNGVPGDGFLSGVARAWEAELFRPSLSKTRRAALRTSLVLAPEGALVSYARMARLGLGGAQLDGPWLHSRRRATAGTEHHYGTRGGRQKLSWIHVDDVVRAIKFIEAHPEVGGPVNVSAPIATDNRAFMAAVRRVLGVRVGLPVHRWLLEPGAWLLRTETELLLKSRWIRPEKLLDAGFEFRHPELEEALRTALSPATMDE